MTGEFEASAFQTSCGAEYKKRAVNNFLQSLRDLLANDLNTATMFSTSLFAFLYLAIQVSATPVVQANQPTGSLPFTKRFNLSSGQHLVQQGQARAKDFIQRGTASGHAAQARAIIGVPVTNQATSYVASVGVGSPKTKCEFIVAYWWRVTHWYVRL